MKPKRQIDKQVRLKKDIVIPAGTVFETGPNSRDYGGNNFDHLIAIGKDNTATLTVYFESDEETAEWIEPVNFESHEMI